MDPITKEILKNMVEIDDEGNIIMTEPKEYFTGDASIDFALNNACADSIDELLDIFEECVLCNVEEAKNENLYGAELWQDREICEHFELKEGSE